MANPGFLVVARLWRMLLLLVVAVGIQGCIYSKPAYSGRVLDAETGMPLKDVEISADYSASSFGFVDTAYKEVTHINVKTNNEGYFEIPSVLTVITPVSWENEVLFTVYKYGYARLLPSMIGDCFAAKGCKEEIWENVPGGGTIHISSGLIKLSRKP